MLPTQYEGWRGKILICVICLAKRINNMHGMHHFPRKERALLCHVDELLQQRSRNLRGMVPPLRHVKPLLLPATTAFKWWAKRHLA